MSLGVPQHLVNRETDGDLLALPPRKTYRVELLFPELPRAHRRVVISHLPASGIKLAAIKAISDAMERDEHICGRHPRRMVLIIEGNSWDYDSEGKPVKSSKVEYDRTEPKLEPAITRLLREWAKARLTTREYRVLLAVFQQTQGSSKPLPMSLRLLADLSGLLLPHCSSTLGSLSNKGMLLIDRSNRPHKICVEKDAGRWHITGARKSEFPRSVKC